MPKLKKLIPTEDQEAAALAGWLDAHNICYCHVPNGGSRHVLEAIKFKRIGTQKGVQDYLIFDSPPKMPDKKGTAIELKRTEGGKVSIDQREWQQKLTDRGWIALICEGCDNAIEALQRLGYGRRL